MVFFLHGAEFVQVLFAVYLLESFVKRVHDLIRDLNVVLRKRAADCAMRVQVGRTPGHRRAPFIPEGLIATRFALD